MFRPRFVLPLVIPLLIFCIPAAAYVIGRSTGSIPTQAEWQSAAHSSGPWMASAVFTACYVLVVGGLILTASGIAFAATTGRRAQLQGWGIQGIGIVISGVFVFYFFGWLFE